MKKILYNNIKKLSLSGFLGAAALFLSGLIPAYSQNPQVTVLSGTTVKITSGSSLNSSENFVLNSGGSLDVQGTLILKKNLINGNTSPDSLGNGNVVFSGSVNHSISGQNIIKNLELNNTAGGLTVLGNTRVYGTLALTQGLVSLGDFNLVLGPAATVTGTPAAANMVVATGAGELRKEFASAGSFTFPVGAADSPPEYAPVTVAYNSGTFAPVNYTGVNLKDIQYPGTDVSYLTMYWNVSQSGVTNFSSNAKFQYNTSDVQGTEADIYCTRVLPAPWIVYNAANTGSHYFEAHGLSAFGTFTGNLGNGSIPPDIRSIQDQTISTGPQCADANQTLLIAGNGTTYLVSSPNGNVKHIARTNIIYYPGTKAESGAYMHGYISTTFCNPGLSPIISAPIVSGVEAPGIISNPNNSFFKIYPNPTPGKFTLELNGDVTSAQVHVEIFGVLGDRILSKDMQIDRKQEFSLTEKPTGVYVVHVSSGVNSETEKIIKR